MMSVKDLLNNRPVFSVDKSASVQEAAEHMARQNVGAVTVMEGSRLVGIFSERDVINRVIAKRLDPAGTPVSAVMTTNLVVAAADETHASCLKKMKQANCRHLPVIDGDTLVGVISLRDLLAVEVSEKEDEIQFLTNYMFHVSPGVEKKYAQ